MTNTPDTLREIDLVKQSPQKDGVGHALISRTEWHDISTAPKDGSYVIVNDTRYPSRPVFIARWNDCRSYQKAKGYWEFADERTHGVGMSRANQPTHWMPLPAAPLSTDLPVCGELPHAD